MTRRTLVALGLLLVAAPASAGLFGGGPPTHIPKPMKPFVATIEDVAGTRVTVSQLSWDGEVHVWVDLGEAEISIPFENVVEVVVSPAGDPYERLITVSTRHAEPVQLVVEHDVPVYGLTAYGNYRIDLGDVKRMTISAPPEGG